MFISIYAIPFAAAGGDDEARGASKIADVGPEARGAKVWLDVVCSIMSDGVKVAVFACMCVYACEGLYKLHSYISLTSVLYMYTSIFLTYRLFEV